MIHLKCNKKDVAKICLLPGDPGRTQLIAEKYLDKPKKINDFRGLLAYTGFYQKVPVSIVTTGMGCPSAGIVVEELVKLGAKILIRIGTCGGVSKNIKPGDLIIPTSAVGLVGIISAYKIEPWTPVPDINVVNALLDSVKEKKLRYWIGAICTSDAFYREVEQAREWEDKKILAFEMECAGIFALAALRGIKAGAILTATGNILYGRQVMETLFVKKSIEQMIKVALSSAYSIANPSLL
ncbi:MAG: nucleoside phosphorylase [Candidatus Firestonebacteria bacterium]